jgi:NAD+ kinase
MTVSAVGIVAKARLREATPHLVAIGSWLRERGIQPIFETATAALLPDAASERVAEKVALVTSSDMIVVLGGDGTLLSMAGCIATAGASIPVLAVNFGSLGFLTEVTLPELYPALEAALSGTARIKERLMLDGAIESGGTAREHHVALNDVVITKAARSRMIDLSIWIGEQFVTRVKADGLIVATPTGSTAYNLASGGPIVQPNVDALIVTPIAPHTLTNRPIVIPATSVVRVRPVIDTRDKMFISFDGQTHVQIDDGDEILVRRSDRTFHLIRPSTRNYFDVLRQKLKWGER